MALWMMSPLLHIHRLGNAMSGWSAGWLAGVARYPGTGGLVSDQQHLKIC